MKAATDALNAAFAAARAVDTEQGWKEFVSASKALIEECKDAKREAKLWAEDARKKTKRATELDAFRLKVCGLAPGQAVATHLSQLVDDVFKEGSTHARPEWFDELRRADLEVRLEEVPGVITRRMRGQEDRYELTDAPTKIEIFYGPEFTDPDTGEPVLVAAIDAAVRTAIRETPTESLRAACCSRWDISLEYDHTRPEGCLVTLDIAVSVLIRVEVLCV